MIAPPRVPPAPGGTPTSAVNRRFAEAAAAEPAAEGATVWVHDYQLQLVPRMLRGLRPDLRIGFFNHIPFPGYEIFAQLPWRRQIVEGLLGADLLGFQRQARRHQLPARLPPGGRADHPRPRGRACADAGERRQPAPRGARRRAFPISIDSAAFERARAPAPTSRRGPRRSAPSLGDPETVLLGVDRLDYTKGILHRLKAYGELLAEGRLASPRRVLVQVASPSRERVEQYRQLRDEVEVTVGRINGDARPRSGTRRCTTCTSPTPARRWRRSTWPPT